MFIECCILMSILSVVLLNLKLLSWSGQLKFRKNFLNMIMARLSQNISSLFFVKYFPNNKYYCFWKIFSLKHQTMGKDE